MSARIATIAAHIVILPAVVYSMPVQADSATGGARDTEAKFITSHGQGLTKTEVDESRLEAARYAKQPGLGRNYSRSTSYYVVLYSELDENRNWVFGFPPLAGRQRDPCWEKRSGNDWKYWRWRQACLD